MKLKLFIFSIILILGLSGFGYDNLDKKKPTATPPQVTSVPTKFTATPVSTMVATETPVPTLEPTLEPTPVPTIVSTPGNVQPYPNAPECDDAVENHNVNEFHTLWDSDRGCHYVHEHGNNPFTDEVNAAFPGLNLYSLLGNVGVGHTNPSGPMENTHKHGGFKWNVYLPAPQNGAPGFEGATYGVDAAVIQYHAFGDYTIELDARTHSAVALLRQKIPNEASGYLYTVQIVDYGQMLYDYQGQLMLFPNRPEPSYETGLGPYWAWQSVNRGATKCGTRLIILSQNCNVATTTTSKGGGVVQQTILALLWRARDLFQVVDFRDQTHPFTAEWLCSNDGGITYAAIAGCRYNNSTTRVHEIKVVIPNSWDNLDGFDTNPVVGRITGVYYTDVLGNINPDCNVAGGNCYLTQLIDWKPGHTGSELQVSKNTQFLPEGAPERDIYFCNGVLCSETSPGAISSGWIGPNN